MPYQKKYYRTKRVQGNASALYKARRPIPKKKGGKINWGAVAKTAVNTAGTVAKVISMLNVEKHFDTIAASVTVTNAGYFQLINGLTVGSTSQNRQGSQIKSTNINLRGKLTISASATNSASQIRIMMIYDNQPNGAIFGLADILEAGLPWSFRAMGYRKRFKVLADHTYQMVDSNDSAQQIVDLSAKLDLRTVYSAGNTGTITDITTGSLYLFAVSDEVTNGPTFDYQLRYRWIDN